MRLIDADSAKLSVSDYKIFRCQLGGLMDVAEFIDDQTTINAVPVVRCKKCVLHGNCITEDAFVLAGIENPFCCAGKRKEGADNG